MMHPAQAIVDAVATVIATAIPSAKVFRHRTAILSVSDNELPGILISITDDTPLADLTTFDSLGSALSVSVTIVDVGSDEVSLTESLLDLRRAVHAAIMPRGALGLPYVLEVGYQGMASIRTDGESDTFIKQLPTGWQVAYRMNRIDPFV